MQSCSERGCDPASWIKKRQNYMHYEVRFLSGGVEQTVLIDAETAAEAAQIAQTGSQSPEADTPFELVQVQLLDQLDEVSHVQPGQDQPKPRNS